MSIMINENRNALEFIVDKMPGWIAYVNIDLEYVYVNDEYAAYYKLVTKTLIGRKIFEVMPYKSYKRAKNKIEAALSGLYIAYENTFEFENGEERAYWLEYIPHVLRNGEVVGYLAHATDITKKKLWEKSFDKEMVKLTDTVADLSKEIRAKNFLIEDLQIQLNERLKS